MTRDELKELIPEITKEQLKAILDKNSDDVGKVIAERDDLKKSLEEKEATIKNLENANGDSEKIKAELQKYKDADEKRKADEKIAHEDKLLNEIVEKAFEGKEFINDMTRSGFASQLKEALKNPDNKGKGASELFADMTKDKENIFKNPNTEKITLPKGNEGKSDDIATYLNNKYKDNPFFNKD